MTLKKLAGALMAVGLGAAAFGAHAQVSGDKVKIGYITDLSGLYADIDGQGGVGGIVQHPGDVLGAGPGRPSGHGAQRGAVHRDHDRPLRPGDHLEGVDADPLAGHDGTRRLGSDVLVHGVMPP